MNGPPAGARYRSLAPCARGARRSRLTWMSRCGWRWYGWLVACCLLGDAESVGCGSGLVVFMAGSVRTRSATVAPDTPRP